ncbi:MAG: hypothetical protein KGZ58_12225 [Ignavibacteriales bacterium]|nr:hypothetical protein [Ignavibacteriales bacterium]
MNHYQKFVSIIGIVLILIGMAHVPVWYNLLLLVAIPLCCIYLAYHYWRLKQNKFRKIWTATFIFIILIYPIALLSR